MKKFILVLLLIGLTTAFVLADQFFIENGTGSWTFFWIYVSDSRSDQWGPDQLGSNVLRPGQRIQIPITGGIGTTTWDIRIVDEDGDSYTLMRRSIRNNEVIRVTLADLD